MRSLNFSQNVQNVLRHILLYFYTIPCIIWGSILKMDSNKEANVFQRFQTCCIADPMQHVVFHISKKNWIHNNVSFYQFGCDSNWLYGWPMERLKIEMYRSSQVYCVVKVPSLFRTEESHPESFPSVRQTIRSRQSGNLALTFCNSTPPRRRASYRRVHPLASMLRMCSYNLKTC